jgi:hypothetical protein
MSRGAALPIAVMATILASGCYEEGGTLPLVFPNEGRTGANDDPGSTAAIMVDSNYIPLDDPDEWHDLTHHRVKVWIRDQAGFDFLVKEANVRAVFNLRPDSWSEWGLAQHGISGVVVLFDLPSDAALGSPTYPQDVWVEVVIVDPPLAAPPAYALRKAPFRLTGSGGSPQPVLAPGIWTGGEAEWLEAKQPVVRLRAKRNGFAAGQVIGSIEFDFTYNVGPFANCVASVAAAREATEAHGVTMVGPKVGDTQRIVLISPDGFNLTFLEDPFVHDPALAGEGPFLDLLIEETTTPCDLSSSADWFTVENLKVSNRDGVLLFSEDDVEVDLPAPSTPNPGATFRAYLIDPTQS